MKKLLNWFKTRSSFISILVVLIAIPLYPKFPLKEVGGTWVAIRVDDILIGLTVLLWGISQIMRKVPIRKNKIFLFFAIYWLVGIAVNLFAIFNLGSVSKNLSLLHWMRRIEYMILFFIAFDALSTKRDLKVILGTIWLTTIGVLIFGMGQKYWGWPVISTMNQEFSKGALLYLDKWTRISSAFSGHYDLAAWLVMILGLAPAVFLFFKKWWLRVLVFILSIANYYLLILTASRVSFMAYLVGITFTLVLLRKYWWIIPIVGLSLLFGMQSKELSARMGASFAFVPEVKEKLIAKINLIIPRPTPMPTPIPEITPTPTPDEKVATGLAQEPVKKIRKVRTWPKPEEAHVAAARSSSIRFQVEWPKAIRAFKKSPFWGTGFSSLGLATDNDYLRMMGETGVLGTAAFLLIIFYLFKEAFIFVIKRKQNWILLSGLLGALVGFASNAVFIDVFEASKVAFYFWILMGIMGKLTSKEVKN